METVNKIDNSRVYDCMCKYLEDDERDLAEFKEFYKENKDSANLEKLLKRTYGGDIYIKSGIYNAPKGATFTPVLDFHNDIKIIRRWVQFFGWVTIIGIVISVIAGIVIGLSAS